MGAECKLLSFVIIISIVSLFFIASLVLVVVAVVKAEVNYRGGRVSEGKVVQHAGNVASTVVFVGWTSYSEQPSP